MLFQNAQRKRYLPLIQKYFKNLFSVKINMRPARSYHAVKPQLRQLFASDIRPASPAADKCVISVFPQLLNRRLCTLRHLHLPIPERAVYVKKYRFFHFFAHNTLFSATRDAMLRYSRCNAPLFAVHGEGLHFVICKILVNPALIRL